MTVGAGGLVELGMKITDVTVSCHSFPLDRPISNARHTYLSVDVCLVIVRSDEGVVGFGLGDGGVGLKGASALIQGIVESLAPWIRGEDPLDVERIWTKMWIPKLVGRRGFTTRVISAIDLAIWDLRAKVMGVPMWKLLGAAQEGVTPYAAGGYYREGAALTELIEEMAGYVSSGFRAVKMKVGGMSLDRDIERVRAVRREVGEDTKLMVDANGAYHRHDAVRMARALEELGVFWFEEPLMPDDYRGLRVVSAHSHIPIAAGENEYTRYGFRDLIEHLSLGILTPDAQFLGGVTEFRKVAALAETYEMPMAPHGDPRVHTHLASATANATMVEYPGVTARAWELVVGGGCVLEKGMLRPTEEPGFGLQFDWEGLARYRVG